MRPNFERQSVIYRNNKCVERGQKSRYVSELGGRRAYPPRTQQASFEQRRALTEEYLSRRNVAEVLSAPEVLEEVEALNLGNSELPAFAKKAEIQEAVTNNQVTIIMGETGSGKSTQVPQFLLEIGLKPTMTQPRIMAANGVAERISDELTEHFGREDSEALVGVHTSERNTIGEHTRISTVTDGLRLAQELGNHGEIKDEVLIVDEVHEWNTNIEILIAFVKRLVAERPQMRVVIMSATIDGQQLANYFADVTETRPPVIEIEGRHHTVEFEEKPESTVVNEALANAEESKSMLVFVAGKKEISDTIDEISAKLPAHIRDTAVILPLHAKQSKAEQDLAYQEIDGLKIIVATEVAQTSITIPGVDLVIDSGLSRRIELDDEDVEGLMLRPVSQDSCRQRGGRTGRDVPGKWILTRYDDKSEFIALQDRDEHEPAEIYSTDLARNVLRTSATGIDFAELDLFHQVDQQAIRRAKDSLFALQALDDEENITPIGRQMNKFSLSPRYARMMIEATGPGMPKEIGAYMAAIATSLEAGGMQYFSHEIKKPRWKELLRDVTDSDPVAQLDLFMATRSISASEVSYNRQIADLDLDPKNVSRAHNQYNKVCKLIDIDPYQELAPPTLEQIELLKECMFTGMVESVYERHGEVDRKPAYLRVGPDEKRTLRTISDRSIVESKPNIVAALPRRYEARQKGQVVEKHIIDTVMPGTREQLAKAALHMSETRVTGFARRGDKVVAVREQYLFGEKIGSVTETDVEWSPELREYIIQQSLEKPGASQRELRAVKSELEKLQRMTPRKLPQITHEELQNWVREAARPGVMSPSHLDANLGQLMDQASLSMEEIETSPWFDEIRRNAPEYLQLNDGAVLEVSYHGEQPPVVNGEKLALLDELPDELTLPDGREVYVRISKGSRGTRTIPYSDYLQVAR